MWGDYVGPAALGLGLAKDVFGGISAYEQARRQKQQYDQAQRFQDPNWVLSQSQPYIDRLNATLRQQTPDLMRSQVNPMIGSRGIDPGSGAGQSIYAQALAPMVQANTLEGMNQFRQASGQGMQYGTTNVGGTYGAGNGLENALKMYMMYKATRPQTTADNNDPSHLMDMLTSYQQKQPYQSSSVAPITNVPNSTSSGYGWSNEEGF